MEDNQIVDLYFGRDERAITESEIKYGGFCTRIAMNILDNAQDAEECVNDTYLHAWQAIPPTRPAKLGAFLAKITRNLSIDRFKAKKAAKRGDSLFFASLDELNECIPQGSTGFGGGFDEESEARRIGECIDRFLRKQSGEMQDVFICRYFYSDSIGEIARRFGLSESKIKSMLHRARQKLRKHLESEGIRL
jgi:RNA polymerase sigma-70 factor (ECF subfamily)